MKQFLSMILFFIISFLSAQTEQQFAQIGDFKTVDGHVIIDCKVGYRTLGTLNADKSNVVLVPTHFTGTSEQKIGWLNSIMDTAGLYIIVVDALTNGVSSSPSNTDNFPMISIRDMVNSQYKMLTEKLGITHVFAVIGISMGGMQTFEWLTAYPDFMDKAVPIIGSPKQSSYDILVWQSMADIITAAKNNNQNLNEALKLAGNIELINLYTPSFIVNNYSVDSVKEYQNQFALVMKPLDVLGGLNAMISHDIYKSSGTNIETIQSRIKADLLVIIAKQDHLVNPLSAVDLTDKLDSQLVILEGNCGHLAVFCEGETIKKAIDKFLKPTD